MRSYKNYTSEIYLSNLSKIDFPDYSEYGDVDMALNDFIGKLNIAVKQNCPT